jgi:polyhydroxybutyrate depolymerase
MGSSPISGRLGKTGAAVLAMLATTSFFSAAAIAAPPEVTGSLSRNFGTIDGRSRSFVLYVPRDLKPGAPLLFMFHGGGGDGPMAREGTGHEFDLLADRNGFIVAYPDGIDRSWTGCRVVQNRVANRRDIDDVKFVDAIIAQEVARHGIDPKRVFATGHSMGAALSYRLALERPKAIAAIAAISSNLPAPDNMDCNPANIGIPVMIINGTADPVSPYNGGTNSRGTSRGRTLSTDATVQYFVSLNGLSGPPAVERLPHQKPSDRTWVERLTWSAPEKPPVILYTVHGGGHVVPQPYYRYPSIVGVMTEDLDAPAVIWDFFSKVPPG